MNITNAEVNAGAGWLRIKWRRLVVACLSACMFGVGSSHVQAQSFSVSEAKTYLVDEVYYLDASLKYIFSSPVIEALENGVTLTLTLDVEIYSPRRYFWEEVIATLEQRYQIAYHALTDQYVLHNLNSGSQFYYSTLASALSTLGHIKQLPIIDSYLLESDRHYMVRVQSRLDFDSLPVPLQLKAYVSSEWWLSSGWYSWDL